MEKRKNELALQEKQAKEDEEYYEILENYWGNEKFIFQLYHYKSERNLEYKEYNDEIEVYPILKNVKRTLVAGPNYCFSGDEGVAVVYCKREYQDGKMVLLDPNVYCKVYLFDENGKAKRVRDEKITYLSDFSEFTEKEQQILNKIYPLEK